MRQSSERFQPHPPLRQHLLAAKDKARNPSRPGAHHVVYDAKTTNFRVRSTSRSARVSFVWDRGRVVVTVKLPLPWELMTALPSPARGPGRSGVPAPKCLRGME